MDNWLPTKITRFNPLNIFKKIYFNFHRTLFKIESTEKLLMHFMVFNFNILCVLLTSPIFYRLYNYVMLCDGYVYFQGGTKSKFLKLWIISTQVFLWNNYNNQLAYFVFKRWNYFAWKEVCVPSKISRFRNLQRSFCFKKIRCPYSVFKRAYSVFLDRTLYCLNVSNSLYVLHFNLFAV